MRSLVVEDDFISRRLLQRILSAFGDADVAVSGEEALEAFAYAQDEKRPYDVICLDINLPGMNGHDVLKSIRAKEKELGIEGLDGAKIIMTTGVDDKDSILSAFREGCEAYVKKPFSRGDIVNKLSDLGYE